MSIGNEQWKLDGNCEICRRKDYCKKNCAASNRAMQRAIGQAMVTSSKKVLGAYAAAGMLAAMHGEYNKSAK